MTRQHARSLAATARATPGGRIELVAPCPGLFRAAVARGVVVGPGAHLGEIEVLGQLTAVIAPPGSGGVVVGLADAALARAPVDHGAMLVTLDPAGAVATEPATTTTTAAATGLVFRAPTSGRFYRRSAPDKPPFVDVGTELAAGTTVCLLEVMKTFHRVTYAGAELPARARVTRLLVADGDDVTAGDALVALEAI